MNFQPLVSGARRRCLAGERNARFAGKNPRHQFPRLTIDTTDGRALAAPDAFAVVQFHRGAWCPDCSAQLRAFERAGQATVSRGRS